MALPPLLLPILSVGATVAGTGMQMYGAKKQAQDQQAAAEFNAEQARKAKAVAAEDQRENALRKQSNYAQRLADMRTRMFEKSKTIEGGDLDFLNEAVGNVQLEIMDDDVRFQRQQAQYENSAFRSDFQAEQAKSAGGFNMISSAIGGVADIGMAGKNSGLFEKRKYGQTTAIS